MTTAASDIVFARTRELVAAGSRPSWESPGALAATLDRNTVQTPALDLIDAELVRLADTPDGRLVISMPPQEGKSERVTRRFPEWMLTRNPDLRIAIASYEANVARRFGRLIRDDINTYGYLLGLQVRGDVAAQSEWQIEGRKGGIYAVGVKGALTSRPADGLVLDDLIKNREQADSEAHRDGTWEFWTDVAATRLAPGAWAVVILTRWHEDDIVGRLRAAPDGHLWRVVNIPAQADHDPNKGETDPLGREPGQYLESARGRTPEQWEAIKVRSGARTWTSLYQGRPAPVAGGILQRDWWRRYDVPQWIERDDGTRIVPGQAGTFELCQSWDMAFKDTKSSDWVVGQVWLRRGIDAYLLDQVRRRMSFVDTCAALQALTARWPQAVAKYVEDKANGTAVMNALARTVPGMIPVEPEGSKEARAWAVSPFVQAGNVWLPDDELAPWAQDLIEEAAAFPNGAHDDQVDTFSQAANRLLLNPLLVEEEIVEPEEFAEHAPGISVY